MLRLSVLMVEYFSLPDIRECIASLEGMAHGLALSPLVVSNSQYGPEELERQRAEFGDAVFLSTGANNGYAGGVNFGIENAPEADYFLILNPDARWKEGQLLELLESLEADPEVGILGPGVVDAAGRKQPSSRAFPKPLTPLLTRTCLAHTPAGKRECQRYFQSNMPSQSSPLGRRDADWVSGGAMLVSRAAALRIGPMDDRYFMYMEDVDWCRTAWSKGLRVVHDPRWEVHHAGQHASLRPGLMRLFSRHTRCHVGSLVRYFWKWKRSAAGWTERP